MNKNTDPRIDGYIADAAPFARPILRQLRKLIHRGCPDVAETIKWNCPAFLHRGKILCMMPAFKAHCGFVFWNKAVKKIIQKDRGTPATGMKLFGRITTLADLPDDRTMLRYIRAAAALNVADKPARPRPAARSRPAPSVPADLAEALKENPVAALAFANFSPSCRREYVGWITEAKRTETRDRRVATTVQWLAEGKQRNWKYLNC